MSQDSMTSGWYYAKAGASAGREVGPLSWEELYRLAESGSVEPSDVVWNPALPRGIRAGMISELFPHQQAPQAPVREVAPEPRPELQPEPAPGETQPVVSAEPEIAPGPGAGPPEATDTDLQTQTDEAPDVDSAEELGEAPRRSRPKRVKEPKAPTESNRLPLLVLLLVVVIAAAGLAAYFLYFRV